MKKIISILLMLTMVLGLFVGCGEQKPAETTGNDLANAKTYLFKMYNTAGKDEENKFLADKDLTSVVTIGGITYPVTWTVEVTAGPADGVKITESTTANHVKLDIMDQPEEELHYTLTGTVKDDKGGSESVSLKCYTPAVKKVEITEEKVVIYNPDSGTYATGEDYLYTSTSSGNQKHELVLTENKADALQLTVRKNDDGTVTFVTNDGKYLMADGTNVQIVDAEGDHTKFVLEPTDGGQFIKCANATYNDKPQYLEVYSGYLTVYSMNETKAPIYTFVLETVAGGASQSAILDAAYSLGDGETLAGGPHTLTGVITSIKTEWDPGYKNITVIIECDGDSEHPMECFRLKGEGAEYLAVGDTITVTGNIKNYKGTIEFDAGCTVSNIVKGEGNETPEKPDDPVIPPASGTDVTLTTGMKVVIYAPSFGKAFSSTLNGYYQNGVDVTMTDGVLSGYTDAEVWTVTVNADGTVSFEQGGQKISMGAEYNSMKMGDVNDAWEVISIGNGLYNIKNAGRGTYIDWYASKSNWSTYTPADPAADPAYQLAFYVVK